MSRSDWRYTLEDDSTMIEDVGVVVKIYTDDLEGDRHQRFVVQLNCDQTLLIVHNIDLVDRVHVRTGDFVEFKGEYEFNHRGGLVHWTHRDPIKKHELGWIKHAGKLYH
tara:strand:+ start:581 stop:907 length:327 start_codon:yes stop_codon:yes gene_type:complete